MKRAQLIRITACAISLPLVYIESRPVPLVSLWCAWNLTGPELDLNCLERLSVEKTLASEDKSEHFMSVDIISLILRRACLTPHIYLSISVPYYICIKYRCTFTPSLAAV